MTSGEVWLWSGLQATLEHVIAQRCPSLRQGDQILHSSMSCQLQIILENWRERTEGYGYNPVGKETLGKASR
jgi:hypothetical protein